MKPQRRNQFRSNLVIEPLWWRVFLAVVVVAVYAVAFVPLYSEVGTAVLALAIFPVVILGWLFGAWGGLIAGVLSVPMNAVLSTLVGEPGWQLVIVEGGGQGSALVVVVGCVVGLLRDLGVRLDRHLTDWRNAQRALRETEERYRVLFERSRDPIYVTRVGGPFVEANDAMVRRFGYPRAELLDLDLAALFVDADDLARLQQQIERTGWVEDFPVQLRNRDGEVRDCLISAIGRPDDDGQIIEVQGSIRDVSEDRGLHELAARRTRELEEAVSELEAFTYSVSHDLRTHLVTLGGFASILWTDHRGELGEKPRQFLRRILSAGHRMERFVGDLLIYGRVGRASVKLEPIDLAEVVAAVRESLAMQIEASAAAVRVEGDLGRVLGDRRLLEAAVENLVSNAVKFVPTGRAPEVRIRTIDQETHVRLAVEDNGTGISSDDVPRAFRAFERLDPAHYEGTGVGLSIVQKAVERMGGEVGVSSEPGRGSTFWILVRAATA